MLQTLRTYRQRRLAEHLTTRNFASILAIGLSGVLFEQEKDAPRGAHQKQAHSVEGDEQIDAAGEEVVAGGQGGANGGLTGQAYDLLDQNAAG